MRKKLGPLFWGSRELKLFDWVYAPGAGVSCSPCPTRFLSYLRTGFGWWWSPPSRIRDGGPVPINRYVLVRDCWSPPKNPLHLWFRRVFGEPFPRDPYRYIHQLDWVPKTLLFFLFSMKKSGCIVLSDLVLSLPSLVCSVVSVEFVVYSCGAIHSSILLILLSVPQIRGFCCKYYDKMLENRALEQWNFYCSGP